MSLAAADARPRVSDMKLIALAVLVKDVNGAIIKAITTNAIDNFFTEDSFMRIF